MARNDDDDAEKMVVDWPLLLTTVVVVIGGGMLLFRYISKDRGTVQLKACSSNLMSIAAAARVYANDNRGRYPANLDKLVEKHYLQAMPTCPAAKKMTYTNFAYDKQAKTVTVSCCGGHHSVLFTGKGLVSEFPSYPFPDGKPPGSP